MGLGSERHDTHSYETHEAQWLGVRQPVLRAAHERLGHTVTDTREINPGEVWEENEFWIDLSWRIAPDGGMNIRQYFESKQRPGEKLTIDEYYTHIFEHSVPGLPDRRKGVEAYTSADPDSQRIWWTDAGVHQNLTFPVHPDPISGMHCWHQAVHVSQAEATDQYGDISVDTEKSQVVYKQWLDKTCPADRVSPDGNRRPYWLLRPLKPSREVYRLSVDSPAQT